MARDYKYRVAAKKKKYQQHSVSRWKWVLVIALIASFIYFLVFLKKSAVTESEPKEQTSSHSVTEKTKKLPKHQNNKPIEPKFEFYTILPETEVVVPDYEIKTRSREERLGKRKASKYIIQAGAFRDFSQADKLRANLAFLGIESVIEKAKVKNVIWNRVKIGPYSRSSKVSDVKKRLKQKGVDAIVTEIKS